MDKKLESAAIITAALLRNHANPSTEQIAGFLIQALDAVHIAVGVENKRSAQKNAELKMNSVAKRY